MQQYFEANQVSIKFNLNPLESDAAFNHLGCTIAYNNSNLVALYQNLGKTMRRWGMVLKVLEKTGSAVRARETMYKSVVQTVIFYGS